MYFKKHHNSRIWKKKQEIQKGSQKLKNMIYKINAEKEVLQIVQQKDKNIENRNNDRHKG